MRRIAAPARLWPLAFALHAGCTPVEPLDSICEPPRIPVWVESDTVAHEPLCAGVARTEEERRAGLTAWPPLDQQTALLLVFSTEGELCITTEVIDQTIDILFARSDGEVGAVACERSPADPIVCADEAQVVLERLPDPGCASWVGGRLWTGPLLP